jgi:hypothetical protein
VDTEARILDPGTGDVLVKATGVYVAADEARKRELRQRYGYVPITDPSEPDPAPMAR